MYHDLYIKCNSSAAYSMCDKRWLSVIVSFNNLRAWTIKLSDCKMTYQDKCNLGNYVNENVKIGCQCIAIHENSIIYK